MTSPGSKRRDEQQPRSVIDQVPGLLHDEGVYLAAVSDLLLVLAPRLSQLFGRLDLLYPGWRALLDEAADD